MFSSVAQNSGISAPNGWITNQAALQNEYFLGLLGLGASLPDSQKEAASPPWIRHTEKNNGRPFPDRHYWTTLFENKTFVMAS